MAKSKPGNKADLQGDQKSDLTGKQAVFAGFLGVARHQKQINPAAEVRNLASI